MKAFILCAGLGTRLKPWTDSHPKALYPVDGVPMLERVIEKIMNCGIVDITVNVHHFADQIIDFLASKDFGVEIKVSEEREEPLETGGALLHAREFLCADDNPILVHNVDILSNADFHILEKSHLETGADATLLVSRRESSRALVFDGNMRLCGWHSRKTGEYRPDGFSPAERDGEFPFSGIYIVNPHIIRQMESLGWKGKFSIIDYLLATLAINDYRGYLDNGLRLKDIGHA